MSVGTIDFTEVPSVSKFSHKVQKHASSHRMASVVILLLSRSVVQVLIGQTQLPRHPRILKPFPIGPGNQGMVVEGSHDDTGPIPAQGGNDADCYFWLWWTIHMEISGLLPR